MSKTGSLMQTGSEASLTETTVLSSRTKMIYRNIGFNNLLKMGHCAPAVMQTLQDIGKTKEAWLVRMTAGLPGGIGNTGYECGGITAPMIFFGLEHGLSSKNNGLPDVIHAGHDYLRRFRICNNSLLCRDILGKRRVPIPCIKVVRHAPEIYHQTNGSEIIIGIKGETEEAFKLLYSHMSANCFHCAHSVLGPLKGSIPVTKELMDGTSGFIGGTAFMGLTCSAFIAGLMAVGIKLGEIEDSYLKVIRMLTIMVSGGNAFGDHLNKFNRLMNIGNRMSKWFRTEFGSTLCSDITQCDFSSLKKVQQYIDKGSIRNCKIIAEKVAQETQRIIKNGGNDF